jgi:predicted secreted protein
MGAMAEDFTHLLAAAKLLRNAVVAGEDVSERIEKLVARSETVLSEDDYVELREFFLTKAHEFQVEATKAEIAEAAFRYSYEQLTDHNVNSFNDLPPDIRDEVLRRVQTAEAIGAPGLKIVYDDDGGFDVVVRLGEHADGE